MDAAFPCRIELLSRAHDDLRAAHECDLRTIVESKIEHLRHYDVAGMVRVAAICHWGRSGSHLLASYLDGHDNVVMLPATRSSHIYSFFEQYPSLSLWDKLIAYPLFAKESFGIPFFEGDWFPISASDYLAAVMAIFEVYGTRSSEFMESRRAFFQFVHVAYSLALGWRPSTPQPLMIYAQHDWDQVKAQHLVEDFPEARFIHTVRDPISAFDRFFEFRFDRKGIRQQLSSIRGSPYEALFSVTTPLLVTRLLVETDRPHSNMEFRTRAVRFEDLHCNTAEIMARIVEWLGLPFQDSLLRSTFNYGMPYLVWRNGKVWSGTLQEQALRHSQNISFTDQALIFALLHDDFAEWHYPHPKIFLNSLVRCITCIVLLAIPMKMEAVVAREVLKLEALPALRNGSVGFAIKRVLGIIYCRLKLMLFVGVECFHRLWTKKKPLQLL
jgi:Sulfotransferase family